MMSRSTPRSRAGRSSLSARSRSPSPLSRLGFLTQMPPPHLRHALSYSLVPAGRRFPYTSSEGEHLGLAGVETTSHGDRMRALAAGARARQVEPGLPARRVAGDGGGERVVRGGLTALAAEGEAERDPGVRRPWRPRDGRPRVGLRSRPVLGRGGPLTAGGGGVSAQADEREDRQEGDGRERPAADGPRRDRNP